MTQQGQIKGLNRRKFLKVGGVSTLALTLGTTDLFSLDSSEVFAEETGKIGKGKGVGANAIVVGHRGSPLLAPEETLASYKKAMEEKVEVLEGDVQLTKDGEMILLHDDTLIRTTNVKEIFPDRSPWRPGDLTLAEIKQLNAGSWFDSRFAGEKIPTVQEVLALLDKNTGVTFELKSPQNSPGVATKLAQALVDAGLADGGTLHSGAYRMMVHSRDEAALKEFHQVAPNVQLLFLTGGDMLADSELDRLASWTVGVFSHPRKTSKSDIERAHARGLKVYCDPVDSPEQIEMALCQGYDYLVTNQPTTALRVRSQKDINLRKSGVVIDHVFPNPSGDDIQPETGEHVTLRNITDETINVSNHYLRDQASSLLRIGDGVEIEPGSLLRVYPGPGTNRPGHYYNGLAAGFLNNTNGDTLTYYSEDHTIQDIFSYIVP
ncbi:glycerophosphodiester phosphodiesterase family protein [Niallia oryzisoli]|uniref:Glycerophosphodiester phosphodiesterase family protein n=1 Tax=Niallia oryzisoli TaxID=1737571 RepID=A0ABZ2CGP8_9BACI